MTTTMELDPEILSEDLISDANRTLEATDRMEDACVAMAAIDAYGTDPLVTNLLMRNRLMARTALDSMSSEGWTNDACVNYSLEGLATVAEDAAKVVAHGVGGKAADIGERVLAHSVSIEKAVARAEKSLLDDLLKARAADVAKLDAAGLKHTASAYASAKAAGKSYQAAEAAGEAGSKIGRMEAAKKILQSHNWTADEQKIIRAHAASDPDKILMALHGHKIQIAHEKVRAAEAHLKEVIHSRDAARIAASKAAVKDAREEAAALAAKEHENASIFAHLETHGGKSALKKMRITPAEKELIKGMSPEEGVPTILAHRLPTFRQVLMDGHIDRLKRIVPGMVHANEQKILAKNAIIALATIGAVTTGVAMLFRSVPKPGATPEAKNAFFGKIVGWVRGIKLPWAKLDVDPDGKLLCNGKKVKNAVAAAEAAVPKSTGPAGWNKNLLDEAAAKVKGTSASLKSSFGGLAGEFEHLSSNGVGSEAANAAKSQMSSKFSGVMSRFAKDKTVTMVMVLMALVASVIYFVVIGGINITKKSLAAQ